MNYLQNVIQHTCKTFCYEYRLDIQLLSIFLNFQKVNVLDHIYIAGICKYYQ